MLTFGPWQPTPQDSVGLKLLEWSGQLLHTHWIDLYVITVYNGMTGGVGREGEKRKRERERERKGRRKGGREGMIRLLFLLFNFLPLIQSTLANQIQCW